MESAPFSTAARAQSQSPAGASNSGKLAITESRLSNDSPAVVSVTLPNLTAMARGKKPLCAAGHFELGNEAESATFIS